MQVSRLAGPMPQGVSVLETLWPAHQPGARERQADRNLAASRDLDARSLVSLVPTPTDVSPTFVYGRAEKKRREEEARLAAIEAIVSRQNKIAERKAAELQKEPTS